MSKKLRLAASVLLLGYLAWQTDWARVGAAFARLRWGWWLAGVGLYAAAQLVSSLRWQLLARPLGFRAPWRRFAALYFLGMFCNLFLPTSVGGDVVRAWRLAGGPGRRSAALLSVLADRGNGLAVLLALACLAVALAPPALPGWVAWGVWAAAAAALCGALAFLLLDLRPSTGAGAVPVRRFLQKVEGLQAQVKHYSRPRLLLVATLLSVVVQAANVVLVGLLGRALGLSVPALYYAVLVPVVTLLTLLPVSLNGMGVREGATVLLLTPVGVDAGSALTLAFLWFAVFTATSLGGVAVSWGQRTKDEGQRTKSNDQPVAEGADGPVGGGAGQGRAGQPAAAA